jgi:hypothetical protein
MLSVTAITVFLIISGCTLNDVYTPTRGDAALDTINRSSYFDDSSVSVPADTSMTKIVSIQRVGDKHVLYPPADKKKVLYLPPGEYKAKIDCEKPYTKKGALDVVKYGVPLGKDQLFTFHLVATRPLSGYSITCAKSPSGRIFVSISTYLEVYG